MYKKLSRILKVIGHYQSLLLYLIFLNSNFRSFGQLLSLFHKKVRFSSKQGRKRPLDTPKRMIERRKREKERERER